MSSIQSQPHLTHASPSHSYPSCNTPNKTSQDVHTSEDPTSEDRDSGIRQRRGCKITSSLAESCGAPSSRPHVEDVHNTGNVKTAHYTRHKTSTRHRYNHNPTSITHPPHTHTHPATHQTNHHKTYSSHQRKSRLRLQAATWLQDLFDLR